MRTLALLILLTGCAGAIQVGPAGVDPDPTYVGFGVDPDNAITIYRPSNIGLITNVVTAPVLRMNGQQVGTCVVGKPLVLRVPNGSYRITAETGAGQVEQAVTVEDGDNSYLRCGAASAPSLTPSPVLEPVAAETADREAGV